MRRMMDFGPGQRRAAAWSPLVVLLIVAAASFYAFLRMYETRGWVAHTHVVIETAERAEYELASAESAQRGYLLTGRADFLPVYDAAVRGLERDTSALRRLTLDNASQQQRLNTLHALARQRVLFLRRGIDLKRTGQDSAVSVFRLEQGRAAMAAVQGVMRGLQDEEVQLLAERTDAERRRLAWLAVIVGLGVVAVGAVGYLVSHRFADFAAAQGLALGRIEEQNEELQQQAVELELQHDNVEQQAAELEALNEELRDRTEAAERAQEAAEWQRGRTAEILDSISDAFFALRPVDGRLELEYANARAQALLGAAGKDVLGQDLWRVAPHLRERLEALIGRALESGQMVRFEDYDPARGAFYAVALYPSAAGLSAFVHDVTDSRAAEARFRVMTEAVPQLIWATTADGTFDYYNQRWLDYTQMPTEGPDAFEWTRYLHPDDLPATLAAWRRALESGSPFEAEYRLRRGADQQYRWFVARALAVRAPDGSVQRWVGSCTDIHDERMATHAVRTLSSELKARVADLETMFQLLPVGISIADDAECRTIRVNRRLAEMLHVPPAENVSASRPDADEVLPYTVWCNGAPMPASRMPLQMAAATGEPVYGVQLDLRFRDGQVMNLIASAAPLRADDGAVRGAVGGFVDVTRRVHAEAELRRLAERTSILYGLSAALSGAVSPEDVGAVACEWGRRVLGGTGSTFAVLSRDGSALEPLHMVGLEAAFIASWPTIPLDTNLPMVEAVRRGEVVKAGSGVERVAAFPETESWPVTMEGLVAAPITFESRTLGAWSVHFDEPRSFTEEEIQLFEAVAAQCAQALERARLYAAERRAREAAEQANQAKLKFLRVMSHDLRTPLNAILGYTELLQEGVPDPVSDSQRTFLVRIRTSTTLLRTLIEDILEFARIEAGHMEIRPADVPVARLFDAVEAVVGAQVRAKGIRLLRRGTLADVAVRADPERVRQVLINLVSNALKFTPAGGEITLSCAADDTRVHMAVHDNGMGIPSSEIERIFEPFVQAHRPQELGVEQGVGLGLAISRELARAMGGEVTADGELGVGSVFTLDLPRAPRAPDTERPGTGASIDAPVRTA